MKTSRLVDLGLVSVLVFGGILLTLVFAIRPLYSVLLYFLPSIIYLSLRPPKKNIKSVFLVSLLFGLIGGGLVDFLFTVNNVWVVNDLVINYRILDVLPVDNFAWWLPSTLFIFLFYEHFVSKPEKRTVPKKTKLAILLFSIAFALASFVFLIKPDVLIIDQFYLKIAIIVMLPLLSYAIKRPKMVIRFFLWSIFFSVFYFFVETTGLLLNHWSYPSEYIGIINLSLISFPVEEIIFWMILGTPAYFVYYEIFTKRLKEK